MKCDSEIKKDLAQFYGTDSTISTLVELSENNDRYRIKLKYDRISKKNMQYRECAFEAWAVILYAAYRKPDNNIVVELCVTGEDGVEKSLDKDFTSYSEHLCRFLYRAMKFREQYKEWFRLSIALDETVDLFEEEFLNTCLTNDVPKQPAAAGTYNEACVERYYSNNHREIRRLLRDSIGLDIGSDNVNQQLPVGLFKETEDGQAPVFPGGAIDLWNINDDSLNIIELKAINWIGRANDEIGIITEMFFYANYMHDLCITKRFIMNEPLFSSGDDSDRGYNQIFDNVARNGIDKINAIILAPKYSEYILDETIDILNSNSVEGLMYYKAMYDQGEIIMTDKEPRGE